MSSFSYATGHVFIAVCVYLKTIDQTNLKNQGVREGSRVGSLSVFLEYVTFQPSLKNEREQIG